MIASVAREYLVFSGIHAGDFHRVLVRVGSSVCEEDFSERIREKGDQVFRKLRAAFARVAGGYVAIFLRLFFYRVDDGPVSVPQIEIDQLGGHIAVALSVHIPEIQSVAVANRDGRQSFLLRPGLEIILAVRRYDFFFCHDALIMLFCPSSSFFFCCFFGLGILFAIPMAPTGHTVEHRWHPTHFEPSSFGCRFSVQRIA